MLKTVSIAGIEEQGVPFKRESINLDEAAKIVSLGNLTWIEVVVDDIVEETPQILERLNITMNPSTLLSGYITEYEDGGDTLGIMVPFIFTGESRTQTSPCLIFVKKDLILTIHDDYGGKITKLYNYSTSLMRKLPQSPESWAERQTMLLFRFPKIFAEGAQQLQESEVKCSAKACLSVLFEISILAKCLGKVQTK